jgi:hypothetical protein
VRSTGQPKKDQKSSCSHNLAPSLQAGNTRSRGSSLHTLIKANEMAPQPLDVASNRQLLFDDRFVEQSSAITHVMHAPSPAEITLESDQPWESGGIHYSSVIQDGDRFRMWYRADTGSDLNNAVDSESWICYAESTDGIAWTKPDLGIVTKVESGHNNILFSEKSSGINPSVIIDPSADETERYKMITRGSGPTCVLGYVSRNGISWQPVHANPILSEPGPFDSQNVLIYDDEAKRYVIYCRGVDTDRPGTFKDGIRAIRRSESDDFRNWTPLELVVTADEDDPADLHLYTNAAYRYSRAQSAWLMFPMILHVDRQGNADSYPGLSDVQFATSRDGIVWNRQFREPFLSPDLDPQNWVDRNPVVGPGILQTSPAELSLYYSERLRDSECRFRRCTIRTDGFVSIHAGYRKWGEFTTPPLRISGNQLNLNVKTSGGGSVVVELQDASGTAIPGHNFDSCDPIFCDQIDRTVTWSGNSKVQIPNNLCKIHFRMRDAHLFAFQFAE